MTTPEGQRPAGAPGPRWHGDGSASRPPGERDSAPGRDPQREIEEAPLVREGNELVQRGRRSVAPPPGFHAYAPFWRRCLAWGIDELLKTGLYLMIMLVVYAVTGGVPTASASEIDFQAVAPRLLLSMGYDWLFWSQGFSPGASLMGMRIVSPDGAPPGGRSAALRVAGSLISAAALFLGYAWMLWSPRRQTWHDTISRTLVVMTREEQPRP
ncbi:MAG: RDD family protein [Chloroflexi bacterium]|nr:RDD family protein [Chloroflexota bacterium]